MNDSSDISCSEQSGRQLFRPGQSGNPTGRPKGIVGGRTRALQILDEVSSRTDNAQLLADAMDAAIKKNPLSFFLKYMAPLMPKEAIHKITTDVQQRSPWRSMTETMAEDRETRRNLQALREEYPGQDAKILGLIAGGCPIGALRIQMKSKCLPPAFEFEDADD